MAVQLVFLVLLDLDLVDQLELYFFQEEVLASLLALWEMLVHLEVVLLFVVLALQAVVLVILVF